MKIKPCNDWVFFKASVIQKIGRIELPDTAQKQEEHVLVLGIGPDVKRIKKNDKIIITFKDVIKYKKDDDTDKSSMYGFIREEDIIANIED